MQMHFYTNDVASSDKFDYWREAVCQSYVQLDCSTRSTDSFDASIELNRFSQLYASYVSGSNQQVERRKQDIAQSVEDYFLVSLQLDKVGTITQLQRTAELQPGDFALYSSIDTYEIKIPDGFTQLVLQIPRSTLLQRLPNADQLTGLCVSGTKGIGSLVQPTIVGLLENLTNANEMAQQCMQDTIIDLVATGLASLDNASIAELDPAKQQMAVARQFIADHLGQRKLNRTMVAEVLGVSLRQLSVLFSREGLSIASYIRQSRLERIAADIVDCRFAHESISTIAMRWGMNNFQHFSTSFKAYFGVSPRDYRHRLKNSTRL